MWGALGSTLGLAMGLALSPVAITTALILLLGERRGRLRAHERVPAGPEQDPGISDAQVLELEALDLEPPQKKGFLSRLDGMGVAACLGLGLAQGVLIIKNIPLGISAGGMLGAADIPEAEQLVSVIIFAVLASLGALLPLVVSIVGGPKVDHALHEARAWIEAHMTAITLVVLLVVGVIFLGEGLGIAD